MNLYKSAEVNTLKNSVFVLGGVVCSSLVYAVISSVMQLSEVFPQGLYRYSAMLFIGGTIFVWMLMLVKPTWSIFALIVLLPVGARLAEYYLLEIGDIVVTADVLAIWGCAIISLGGHGLKRDPIYMCFGLFLLAAVLSLVINSAPLATTILFSGILTPFLMYEMIVSHVRDIVSVKLIVRALGYVAVLCSVFALMQPFLAGNHAEYFYQRLPSVFYSPVIFANVLILLWPFTLIYDPFGSAHLPKLTLLARCLGVIVSFSALLLTGTRGAIIICAIQILWLRRKFIADNQYNTRYARYVLSVLISGILVMIVYDYDFLRETVLRRFYDLNFAEYGNSAYERKLGILASLELGVNNPFLGIGLGNFKDYYPITKAATTGMCELESAHNFILNLFSEMGLLGLSIWLVILSVVLKRLNYSRGFLYSNDRSTLFTILKCSLVGYTATQFAFYGEFLHKNVGLPMTLYFIVFGLSSSLYFMRGAKQGPHA